MEKIKKAKRTTYILPLTQIQKTISIDQDANLDAHGAQENLPTIIDKANVYVTGDRTGDFTKRIKTPRKVAETAEAIIRAAVSRIGTDDTDPDPRVELKLVPDDQGLSIYAIQVSFRHGIFTPEATIRHIMTLVMVALRPMARAGLQLLKNRLTTRIGWGVSLDFFKKHGCSEAFGGLFWESSRDNKIDSSIELDLEMPKGQGGGNGDGEPAPEPLKLTITEAIQIQVRGLEALREAVRRRQRLPAAA